MSQNIKINDIKIEETEKTAKLIFEIEIKNQKKNIWYSVNKKYKEFLCDDRCDAIVVLFLLYAMKENLSFKSAIPISERLYMSVTRNIIPQIYEANKDKCFIIDIDIPTTTIKYNNNYAVGTGISCGVDSFTTLYEYSKEKTPENYKITHLTYFNVGAHHNHETLKGEDVRNLYNKQLKNAQEFCKTYNYELIDIDSNVNDELPMLFAHTTTFRNVSTMMIIQKLFKIYYHSPGYDLNDFSCKINIDPAHYEHWLLPLLETENIRFIVSNKNLNRIEKTKLISDFNQTYDWLNVCREDSSPNCGKCDKCLRTLMALDALNKLDYYKNSFNIDEYLKNRKKYWKDICYKRYSDSFLQEVYNYAISVNYPIPKIHIFLSNYRKLKVLIPKGLRKSIKKILPKSIR